MSSHTVTTATQSDVQTKSLSLAFLAPSHRRSQLFRINVPPDEIRTPDYLEKFSCSQSTWQILAL